MSLLLQQRSVVRYYCLRLKSNREILAKLQLAYHEDALCLRAVEKWAARFRAGQETVDDETRPGRPAISDLSEAILQFLERQPHSSSRDISKALYLPKTTVLRIMHEIGLHFFAPRWVPYRLSDAQKADRVTICKNLIDMMISLGPKQAKYLITGDESWIYWDNQLRGMWAEDRDDVPPNVNRMVSSKKTMVSAYFTRWGFVSIEFLPQGQNYNSQFFIETVLPSIEMKLSQRRPRLRATGAHLHMDNAKPHRSKKSIEKAGEMGFVLVPHPPYSPDIAPSDFFLFGYLKECLAGTSFPDEETLISAVHEILTSIPIEMLCRVFDDWIRRLHECVARAGEYVS
jgi:histone-lysine N-methyltransferase SETMAR